MIQLRAFQNRDLEALFLLDQACFPPQIAYSMADLVSFLSRPRGSCWIAEHPIEPPENLLAGFIIIDRDSPYGRSAAHIVTLDIHPKERRHGLGSLLMRTAEEQIKIEGVQFMSLEVAENNAAAQQFYRSLGFQTSGRIPKYYGGNIDARVMEKRI